MPEGGQSPSLLPQNLALPFLGLITARVRETQSLGFSTCALDRSDAFTPNWCPGNPPICFLSLSQAPVRSWGR